MAEKPVFLDRLPGFRYQDASSGDVKMDFDDWAPKALCDYYNEFEGPEEEKKLLERLLSSETMKPVWEAFEKRYSEMFEKSYPEMVKNPQDAAKITEWRKFTRTFKLSFASDRYDASYSLPTFRLFLALYRLSGKELRTTREKIEKFREIADSAKKLSRTIKGTELDRLLPWSTEYLYLDLEDERPNFMVPGVSSPPMHMVSTFLKEISKRARNLSGKAEEEKHLDIVPYVGARNARANYFVRLMSIEFKRLFGSPRPALLTALACIVLDDDETITEDMVKSTLKEWKNNSRRYWLKNKSLSSK